MIISLTLSVMAILAVFSLIIGGNLIGTTVNVLVDNSALINGSTTTFEVVAQDVLFQIDTTTLIIAGIALIVAVSLAAAITGIQVLGSGINTQSAKIMILITGYTGIWASLSIISFQLIFSIEVFGSVIYITLTIGYAVGVLQKIGGG